MHKKILIGLALLAACSPSPEATPTVGPTTTSNVVSTTGAPTTSTTVDAVGVGAAVDLDGFLRELDMTHPDPFHGISRAEFVAAMDELKAGIDQMSPATALVEAMRLTALLSRQGRDGHQFAIPHEGSEGPILPFRIYEFDDGVFITDALERDLIGARLMAIGGHPIAEVLAAVEPLVPRDGPATVPSFRPFFTLRVQVLEGLELIGPGPIEISLEREGMTEAVSVEPISVRRLSGMGGSGGVHVPSGDGHSPIPIFRERGVLDGGPPRRCPLRPIFGGRPGWVIADRGVPEARRCLREES